MPPSRKPRSQRPTASPLHPASPRAQGRRRGGLDEADIRLMELLTEDGRASNRFLAEQVGLTEATVAARIRSLVQGHVMGVTAVFDWEAAGYHWPVWLFIKAGSDRLLREVAEELASLGPVQATSIVFGSVDVMVQALLPTRDDVTAFLTEDVPAVKGISRVRSAITLEVVKYTVNYGTVPVRGLGLDFPEPIVELDDLDRSIITALVEDGRRSNRDIGRHLGVSDGTVRARLRRIEDAGLMRICAQIDPITAGTFGGWGFVGVTAKAGFTRDVSERLAEFPEVLTAALITGDHDILLFVAAEDRARMVELIAADIRHIDGVTSTETWDVIDNVHSRFHWGRLNG